MRPWGAVNSAPWLAATTRRKGCVSQVHHTLKSTLLAGTSHQCSNARHVIIIHVVSVTCLLSQMSAIMWASRALFYLALAGGGLAEPGGRRRDGCGGS